MELNLTVTKLQQIASDCPCTIDPVTVGQWLADPRMDLQAVAAALSTTPAWLQAAIDRPETESFMQEAGRVVA